MQREQPIPTSAPVRQQRQAATRQAPSPELQRKCTDCEQEEQASQAIQKAPATTTASSADGTDDTVAGMPKATFFEMLESALCNDVNSILAGTPYTASNCPWLRFWIDTYAQKSASELESAIIRYTGLNPAEGAVTVIEIISQRVQGAVLHWLKTGEVTGVPEAYTGWSGMMQAGWDALQLKGNDLPSADPRAVQQQLGDGQTISGAQASRFGQAFGKSFSDVRIHTDSKAVQLSKQMGARAFTVGNHVAFGAGEYRPGSITGDALMAHELAHVQQQRGGETRGLQAKSGASYGALETDADNAAVGVVSSLWGQTKEFAQGLGKQTGAALRTGLRLQGCKQENKAKTPTMPSITAYKDQSKPANDPADISDTHLKLTQEYNWLYMAVGPSSKATTKYTADQVVMALRLIIRDYQDGLLTAIPTDEAGMTKLAVDYLHRGSEQLAAGKFAEANAGNFKWTPFSSAQARVDASKLNTEVGKWLLLGGTAPKGPVTVMNCWEFVMYGAYLAKVISYNELRALYLKAQKGSGSFGDFFESELRASKKQTYKMWDPDTENPLPGDIVIFNTAANHAAIATGKKAQLNMGPGKTHMSSEIMSLWNNDGMKLVDSAANTYIDVLGESSKRNGGAPEPITFWSVKWKI